MITLLSVLIICGSAIASQLLYYREKRMKVEIVQTLKLSDQIEKELKDLQAYKDAVRTLTLKAGLKF